MCLASAPSTSWSLAGWRRGGIRGLRPAAHLRRTVQHLRTCRAWSRRCTEVKMLVCRASVSAAPVPAFYYYVPWRNGGREQSHGCAGLSLGMGAQELGSPPSFRRRLASPRRSLPPARSTTALPGLRAWSATLETRHRRTTDRRRRRERRRGLGCRRRVAVAGPPGTQLAGQMLLCPMLDDRNDTASAWRFEGHGVWDRRTNLAAWRGSSR